MKQESNIEQKRSTKESTTSAAPNLYLQIIRHFDNGDNKCLWCKLDLEREEALVLNWQSEYIVDSIVVVLKSEIYVLGGVQRHPGSDADVYLDDVHRINTAATPLPSRFESAPSMLCKRSERYRRHTIVAVVGDKIIFFNSYDCRLPHKMEIFDRSSDRWFVFSAKEVRFPSELEESYACCIVSDPRNNRILMEFLVANRQGKGLYAFYPDSFRWECLNGGKKLFYYYFSIVVNTVLYYLEKKEDEVTCLFVRYEFVAMDLADGCKPLKIVWPSGFDHQFFRKTKWMDVVDLGDGKLCLVSMFYEHLDVPPDYDSDEYYYSRYHYSLEETGEEEKEDEREKMKYLPVITCLILEAEKQDPPPQPNSQRLFRKTKLVVKIVSRLNFKLEDFIFDSSHDDPHWVGIMNALVVPRSVADIEMLAKEHCAEPTSATPKDHVYLSVSDMKQPAKEHCAEELISGAHHVYLGVSKSKKTFYYKFDLEHEKAISMDCNEFERTINTESSMLNKYPHLKEIYDRLSNYDDGRPEFSRDDQDIGLPHELEGLEVYAFTSDQENNRILINFINKGLYAFYPESCNWESLSGGKCGYDLILDVAIGNVLYGLMYKDQERECKFVRFELVAFDLADGCKPLKIVWPPGLDIFDPFFTESKRSDTIDLGNGKLCIVSLCDEHLEVPSDYDSDEYYSYSGDDKEEEGEMKNYDEYNNSPRDNEEEEGEMKNYDEYNNSPRDSEEEEGEMENYDEYNNFSSDDDEEDEKKKYDEYCNSSEDDEEEEGEMKKYMPVVRCLILEFEKQPPPPQLSSSLHRKTKLLVKTFSRLNFELDNLVYTGNRAKIQLENVIVVPR